MPDPAETRTYWVSFAGPDVPGQPGAGFLGAVVVDVTTADVECLKPELAIRFPQHDPEDGPWLAAVSRACHHAGVNPGGEMACWRLDNLPDGSEMAARYPRLTLMSRGDIEQIDGEPPMTVNEMQQAVDES